MFIAGLGVATPPQRYTQREGWDAVQKSALFARLAPRSRAILQKVLCGDNGILSSPTVFSCSNVRCMTPCPTASGGCRRSARDSVATVHCWK
jgi:hypothetical protein